MTCEPARGAQAGHLLMPRNRALVTIDHRPTQPLGGYPLRYRFVNRP
jgi:hypothetical protein